MTPHRSKSTFEIGVDVDDRSRRASRRNWIIAIVATVCLLPGCASFWSGSGSPRVQVIGLEPLPGEEMEARFALQLRVQNHNEAAIEYRGIAIELEVNDRPFAIGVSDARGTIPGFTETVISLPVSISAWSMMRQMFGLMDSNRSGGLPYRLSGKLGGERRSIHFESEGVLELPGPPVGSESGPRP